LQWLRTMAEDNAVAQAEALQALSVAETEAKAVAQAGALKALSVAEAEAKALAQFGRKRLREHAVRYALRIRSSGPPIGDIHPPGASEIRTVDTHNITA
jgi:pyruvate/2-oxoglutarate dehydrogenase complex dihydrolipoamide acyltransferase (E2) component